MKPRMLLWKFCSSSEIKKKFRSISRRWFEDSKTPPTPTTQRNATCSDITSGDQQLSSERISRLQSCTKELTILPLTSETDVYNQYASNSSRCQPQTPQFSMSLPGLCLRPSWHSSSPDSKKTSRILGCRKPL
jgi:hypothetical protein